MAITEITTYLKCCGCGVCATVCPKHCISMHYNEEGFLYPYIDKDLCIECKLCQKSCPTNNSTNITDNNITPKVFACVNKNINILKNSSSGGVFFNLANYIITNGGVVYGASFDLDNMVKHIRINSIGELPLLMGSKYVQSNTTHIWNQIKTDLDSGHNVLFSGTPCEVGALKKFLKHDYVNLFCIDLICMGTPSPGVWKRHISDIEKKYHSRATFATFRNKQYGANAHSLFIKFNNGKLYWRPIYAEPYVKAFHSRLFLRPSCHNCSYKGTNRVSDITLADFWGIETTNISIDHSNGISMVIIHSQKGIDLFSKNKEQFYYQETTIETAQRVQPMLTTSCEPNGNRNAFFKSFKDNPNIPFSKIVNKFQKITVADKIRYRLKKKTNWLRTLCAKIR